MRLSIFWEAWGESGIFTSSETLNVWLTLTPKALAKLAFAVSTDALAVSKENSAYHYLPESIKVVPQGEVMANLLRKVGFAEVGVRKLTFGVCSLYTGRKL